jgi:hypothetical protein
VFSSRSHESSIERGKRSNAAEIYQFAPYHYGLPEDLSEIGAFIQRVLAGEVGFLASTIPPQLTILMDAAGKAWLLSEAPRGDESIQQP